MLRSVRILLLLLLMLAGASADRVFALGLGGYISGAGGGFEGTYSFDGEDDAGVDGSARQRGVGFVMEVHPVGRSIFNYRLSVGLARLDISSELDHPSLNKHNSFGPEFDLWGVAMDHVFGFAVLRNDVARLWIGPTLRAGFYAGDGDIDYPAYYWYNLGIRDVQGYAIMAEVGIGAAFGANFHIGDRFTISPTVGFRVSEYGGINRDQRWNTDDTIAGAGGTGFFSLSFMARTGNDAK